MKKHLIERLVARLIFLVYKFLCMTVRWEFAGYRYSSETAPFVLGFWHARILMLPYAFQGWNGALLISEHQDGGFIAGAAKLMGLDSIRGSSTRGGARAFLEMIRVARQGRSLGVTPDGPKGPAEKMKPGVVQLAKKSGLPFRAACYATRRHWRANSWDRFYIPKPFTRGVFVISEEVYADSDDDQENLERFQAIMDQTQQKADNYFTSVS